ncbi:MAG: PSD1 and planctomycete cytochrome C domain-containing protein [Gemmataceae bacterium]
MFRSLSLAVFVFLHALASARAGDPGEFFEKSIRPVLVEHCLKCHGGDPAKDPKGGLRVDSRTALLKGGDSGPSIVPGEPAKSRLLDAMKYGNVDLQMPPKGKLPDATIRLFETWIKDGAVWPGEQQKTETKVGFDLAKRKAEHWCWKPLANPEPPRVADADWNRNAIDRFVRARLDAKGLSPNAPADTATLLRRLSFDLTGLPPTASDLDALAKGKPYESFVEQYLASPRFGERWARHWMDIVRYADTRGHEFDYAIPAAWRYRDYLIRAFNADIPYRDFVTEHIAGDRITSPRRHADGSNESIQGTGFWLLGEELHSPVDIRQDQADRFDNRIDVFGKAFLGLTIACARCHDHKFDAITAKDYYALFALLEASSPRLARIDSPVHDVKLKSGQWHSDGNSYRESGSAITFDPSLDRPLKNPSHDRIPGELAKYDRSGRVLRSPDFTIEKGKVYILIKGSAVSYATVGQHTMIAGPLHGSIVRELRSSPKWRWESHDLSAYQGQRTHIEFSPLSANEEFSIAAITQAEQTPPLPKDLPVTDKTVAITNNNDLPPKETRLALALWEGSPLTERVFVRGSPKVLGEEVPPRFLEALSGADRLNGGRLALAAEMTDAKRNPLTYRVFANRVWHYLFGTGIVPSVDNFGVLGETPSHPELLDHLAGILRDRTPKELIRQVVLSKTYRMSSHETADAELKDPGNRLLHRQNLRRLDSEAIRDAILAVSGRLDVKEFGPSIPVYVSPYQDGRGRPESGPLDGNGRRSVYIRVQRNFLSPFQLAFDSPIPFSSVGRRQVSNVPAQALILLNDDFVNAEAKRWAESTKSISNVDERIVAMYRGAFGRAATKQELETCRAFLGDKPDFAALGHALLNVKEFTYLP